MKNAALAIPNTTGDFHDWPDIYIKRHEKHIIFCDFPEVSSGGLKLLEIPSATGVTWINSSWITNNRRMLNLTGLASLPCRIR